ncbi:MAG: glycosyltransferase family 4 protein [Gemmatimonadetes bacterium]|nr:glycosyltransferase family 4 protein [Gemmatimonadota bacterium]
MLLNAGRGSGEVARQQGRQLLDRGHDVVFMHPGMGRGIAGAVNVDVPLPGPTLPVHEYLPSAGEAQKAVSTMDHEEASALVVHYEEVLAAHIDDLDVVIAHHGNLVALAARRVCTRAGKPFALFLHGTGVEPRHSGGYDDGLWAEIAEAIRHADGLLVTTEYVRDFLVRPLVDVEKERFLILPCGIDLDEFHPGRDDGVAARYDLPARYVICPGALTHSKGPQNVVAAAREYADLAYTVLIGDGELRPQLENDLADRGRCLGFVPAADKAFLINGATLLVAAPVKKEHFGIIYAEALSGGTPCVAYEGGGVDSIVTPDVGVLTQRDPEALGRGVRRLLEDDRKRESMEVNARRRAEERFDAVELGAQLEDWLAGLVQA